MASSKSRKSASSVATEVVSSSVPDQVTDQDIALINELTTPDNVDALEGVLEAVVGVAEATNHVETLDPIVSAILNDPETSQPSTEETANTDQPYTEETANTDQPYTEETANTDQPTEASDPISEADQPTEPISTLTFKNGLS